MHALTNAPLENVPLPLFMLPITCAARLARPAVVAAAARPDATAAGPTLTVDAAVVRACAVAPAACARSRGRRQHTNYSFHS